MTKTYWGLPWCLYFMELERSWIKGFSGPVRGTSDSNNIFPNPGDSSHHNSCLHKAVILFLKIRPPLRLDCSLLSWFKEGDLGCDVWSSGSILSVKDTGLQGLRGRGMTGIGGWHWGGPGSRAWGKGQWLSPHVGSCISHLWLLNKAPRMGCLRQQTFIVSQSWRLEIRDQGVSWVSFSWGLYSWLVEDHLLSMSSQVFPSVHICVLISSS